MSTAGLLLAALGCYAAAGAADLLAGVRRAALRPLPYLLAAGGAAFSVISGARAVAGHPGSVELGTFLGFGTSRLVVDSLAGLFLTITGAVAVPVSLAFASWAHPAGRVPYRSLGASYALTCAAVVIIITADNAFVFLFAWESLTVAFYLLAGYQRARPGRADASFLTLAVSKTSGACVLVGFLLLAGRANSFHLADWAALPSSARQATAYTLLIVGFAVKVGLIPLQIWMPAGYTAAPGPARAVMAGVAVNVGFYGLWRTLSVLGAPPTWLALALLLTAAATALLGVAHAAVQTDLPRVIAYSSVENGGLILTGYSVALLGSVTHNSRLQAVGLLAATLQLIAHAVAKSALFLATANFEAATGVRALESLRGLGRDMPWSGTAFGVGALTLAGLPPTVGFVSEWFLLEALMQQFRVHALTSRLAMALAGAMVALTAGFAVVAFVRILALSILGSTSHRRHRRDIHEPGLLGRFAVTALAASCVAVAALTPLEIRFLARGLAAVVPASATGGAWKSPWVVQPVFPDFSVLSPSWLAVELPVMCALTLGGALVLSRGSLLRVRRVPAWRSATGGVDGQDRYTPFGYANPTRKVLANVLMTRTELRTARQDSPDEGFPGPDLPPAEGTLADDRAGTRDGAATPLPEASARLDYRSDVVELVEVLLYRPLIRPLSAVVRTAKLLQSGRLDAYIAYMLITLIALLAIVTALA